ncbi:MAG: hypothetical protein IJU07_09260, partial [Synergistaceae bacterium]|nr:hypothetical protein [Synergistaceae bacterium]
PDGWQETMEIQTSNSFEQPAGAVKARVLFVIDDSGSMSSATANLANNLGSFIQKIAAENVEEVSVGVASYSYVSGAQRLAQHQINGNLWGTVDSNNPATAATALQDITTTLNILAGTMIGGTVDHYYGIGQAINDYGLVPADSVKNYVVLLTDTGAESSGQNGISRSDVKQLLTDSNSELITICPTTANSLFQSTDSTQALVTMSATNPGTSDWSVAYDYAGTWGTTLSNSIGPMIGINAVQSVLFENVPLYEFPQLQGVFPSASSSSQVITIHQGDKSYDITIDPDDTFETLNNKLNQYTGASTTAEVVDLESGKKGIRMITSIPSGERVTYSGNQELLTQLGLRSNFDHKFSLDADKVTDRDIHFRTFYLNKNTGHVHEGDIVLSTNSTEIPEYDLLTSFEAAYIGQIPKHDVKLTDINNFWNTEGVFIVDQPKTITITQGNGKTTSVTLYKTDTLDEVRDKLNNAIANDLGQSKYTDANKFVSYVKEGEELKQGDESVAGTFIVRSAVPGKSGELYFSGDDEILRALGLNTIHESSESRFTASVYNAHSGTQLATGIKATGNVLTGIIPNVDIEFDAMAGIKSSWDENTKRYFFTDDETYSATLHLRDNGIIFQTGANKGEDFTLQLGDTSCSSLGIVGVNVASRNNASHSIGVIDRAINRISSQRAKIGAFINGLEHTMTNLTTTTANLTSAESRIRDADMSKTMMEFVKLQVLNQSGTSMLAQANQLPRSVLNLIGG